MKQKQNNKKSFLRTLFRILLGHYDNNEDFFSKGANKKIHNKELGKQQQVLMSITNIFLSYRDACVPFVFLSPCWCDTMEEKVKISKRNLTYKYQNESHRTVTNVEILSEKK